MNFTVKSTDIGEYVHSTERLGYNRESGIRNTWGLQSPIRLWNPCDQTGTVTVVAIACQRSVKVAITTR